MGGGGQRAELIGQVQLGRRPLEEGQREAAVAQLEALGSLQFLRRHLGDTHTHTALQVSQATAPCPAPPAEPWPPIGAHLVCVLPLQLHLRLADAPVLPVSPAQPPVVQHRGPQRLLVGGGAVGGVGGAAGEARGGSGDCGHAAQRRGEDVGNHHGAHTTLLLLRQGAGLRRHTGHSTAGVEEEDEEEEESAHQCDDTVLSLHLLPEVLEAAQQPVVQRFQLLRRLLAVNPDPVSQERDLEEEKVSHLRGGSRAGGASPAGR